MFLTILQSVNQTQMKNKFSYNIGVATIFLVSTFVTVLLSATSLTSIIFVQMGQSVGSDVDIIMTGGPAFEHSVSMNYNPYAVDRFVPIE